MPTMSGMELQSLLIAKGHRIPVIFMTVFSHEGMRAAAMSCGALCYLPKPFDAQVLVGCLMRLSTGTAAKWSAINVADTKQAMREQR